MTVFSVISEVRRRLCLLAIALLLPVPSIPVAAQNPAPPAAAIKLIVKEGEGALNNIRVLRAKEPVVLVTDDDDQPLAGAQVMFLLPELGASGVFPSGSTLNVTTGKDGLAVGRGLKPNNVVGEFQIRVVASHQGHSARASITQTNVAQQKSGGGGGKTALILALLGGAGAAVAVGVTRGGDKGTPAPSGTSISAGGSTFGPPR